MSQQGICIDMVGSDNAMPPQLRETPEGVILPVRAQPGARRNGVVGIHNGSWKIAVTAVAQKGAANAAILEVLADALQVSRNRIRLVRGDTARHKEFAIADLSAVDVTTRLKSRIPS